ncbi:uncharacterized protein LOC123680385 [Harmonia axyridis]|uniref:uncharacterized protein LOC123680385 n=1 Tax=Harmonia axyridis TaxID=115357 RepID=UPI001E278674|nr:uncharacterized protein LOC123680385 [Harmonia axyridis]
MEIYENMARFEKIKENPKDYLKIFIHMTYGLLNLRLARPFLVIANLFHICSLTLTLYKSLVTLDPKFVMKFGPAWGLEVFMLINLWLMLEKQEILKGMFTWHERIRIPYEIMDEELNKKVEMLSKIPICLVLMNYGLALLSFFFLAYSFEYFNDKSYSRVWIINELPGYYWSKIVLLYVVDFISATVMVSSPTAMIYFGTSGVFRIMLINKFVKSICSSQIPEDKRYDSELYQKLVEQKLKICVLLHDQAISDSILAANIVYAYIILFFLGSILMGVSLMMVILMAYIDEAYIVFIGANLYGICCLISGSLYITIGQILKDHSELIWYNLGQLPWYYMNKKNIKTYSIFLRKSQKPIALSTDLLEVNFLVFVRIFRALYSLAAFIMRMSPPSD